MSNTKWAALGVALLASTALTTGASAAEWSASMGGSAELGIAYVDTDDDGACGGDCDSIGLINDSQIIFDFNIVADNGITFGYRFDFDPDGLSGDADEYNAYISGSFGRVEIGNDDGASDKLNITPPGCSFSCVGDGDGYLWDHFSNVSNVTIDADGDDTGDDLKISYFTPNFYGFTAGASWVPQSSTEGVAQNDLTVTDTSAWEVGARYRGDITEDFDLGVSVVYADADDDADFGANLAIAAEVGIFGSTSVGGRWIDDEGPDGADDDRQVLSLGIEHGMGPWGFFLNWAQNIDADDDDLDGDWGINAEVDYALAPGVTIAGIVEYGSPTEDLDNEFAIGTSLGLSF